MPDMPIPAGEAGFNLEINTILHNLNDKKISDCQLYIFLPDNFNWTDMPKTCKKQQDFSVIPTSVNKKRTIQSANDYLLCNIGTVNTYEKYSFKITISVLNYKATQQKYSVLILEPIAVFTDSQNKVNTLVDYVKVNCEAASLLRVAINPDPSSFYPVKGEGQYVDNVVKIENKEQTGAFDVEYVGLIPLISPLTDGDDQRKQYGILKYMLIIIMNLIILKYHLKVMMLKTSFIQDFLKEKELFSLLNGILPYFQLNKLFQRNKPEVLKWMMKLI